MNDKDIYFKNKFDTTKFEDDIYTQLTKNMAKAVDIDFAKTPVIDILTGYINYVEFQSNWNSLREWLFSEYLKKQHTKENNLIRISILLDKMNELEGKDKE